SELAIGVMRRPAFGLVAWTAGKKRMHIFWGCIGRGTRLRTHRAFGHEYSRCVRLMFESKSVNEGVGLSGVPALDSVGERSAKCTSALSPVNRRITSPVFRVSFFARDCVN